MVGVLCSILFHAVVREAPVVPTPKVDVRANSMNGNGVNGTGTKPNPVSTQKTVKEHLCSLKLYLIAAVYMSTRLFVNLSQVSI